MAEKNTNQIRKLDLILSTFGIPANYIYWINPIYIAGKTESVERQSVPIVLKGIWVALYLSEGCAVT